ncbi:MAG TPA: hypothetical protein VFP72_16050 [Kineosporiaceae bacterium]|nr:hypothetical protein [Kineosporiaceae bacterium]
MGSLDRIVKRVVPQAAVGGGAEGADVDDAEESRLWAVLKEDPNDEVAFARLAELVRQRAGEGHEDADQQRAAGDAVWALAEELAHSGRAWYPLLELARLSVHDDREAALRRLATASERDSTGRALAKGLQMLREEHLPDEALGLGVGHWRPREHDPEAGRQLVEAAVEAGRKADARRHLDALSQHPDVGRVQILRAELERRIAEELAKTGQIPVVDVREAHPESADVRDVREPRDTGGLNLLRGVFRRPKP